MNDFSLAKIFKPRAHHFNLKIFKNAMALSVSAKNGLDELEHFCLYGLVPQISLSFDYQDIKEDSNS